MRKVANFCDYFVVCNGTSDRQVRAIADGIDQGLKDTGVKIRYKQGLQSGVWALLDLGDVVVHIFEKEAREFYGLEYLWKNAVRVHWKK